MFRCGLTPLGESLQLLSGDVGEGFEVVGIVVCEFSPDLDAVLVGRLADEVHGNAFETSARLENTSSFRHSSRKRPLKLSTNPFCCGLPGAM